MQFSLVKGWFTMVKRVPWNRTLRERISWKLNPKHVSPNPAQVRIADLFFITCAKQSSHLNSRTWPQSKRKLPCGFDAAFFKTVFRVVKKKKTLCCVQVYLREETLQPTQVALTKMPRNEAKIYQDTDFLSTEGHLLTSSGCFLTLTSLDVVQVRFAFVAFCLWTI